MKITQSDMHAADRTRRQRSTASPAQNESAGKSAEASTVSQDNSRAAMQALVSSLRGEFAQAGIVPPPRNFAGVRVIQPVDLADVGQDEQSEHAPRHVSTLDKMRMIMVKGMLSRLSGEDASDSASEIDMAV